MKTLILWLILIVASAAAGWVARGYRDKHEQPTDPEELQQEHGDWFVTLALAVATSWCEIMAGAFALTVIITLLIAFITS